MFVSVIVAARNEGESLWKTVRSCSDGAPGSGFEVIVADDHSDDGSIEELQRRFPRVRVVRHADPTDQPSEAIRDGDSSPLFGAPGFEARGSEATPARRGAAATKDLGARHCRGEILVFLDGHCHVDADSLRRLVEDVRRVGDSAIITPTVTTLDTHRWRCSQTNLGHGYYLDLERLSCGWLPLERLRKRQIGRHAFYESPALIGCALAVTKTLYEYLRGFDPHMRLWGVEDLDFGLKAWLLGYPILHDPVPRVGHRFRRAFDAEGMPMEQMLANQLRMARKHFTDGVWADWVNRCRHRHPGGLTDPHQSPEGLWAKAWLRFERDRVSAEFERAYLLGRRTRDEFWYAQRFGLRWPELYSPPSAPFATQYMTEATPSPEPCELNGVDPDEVTICVGQQQEFNAEGENLDGVDWSTDPEGTPSTGEGDSFQTEWLTPGQKTVTATCGESSTDAEVTVIRVTFDTQKVKTGFTKPVPESTISRTLVATVEPASAVESVVMQVSGEDRATFDAPVVDTSTGTITLEVKGKSGTPAGFPNGDTAIEAVVDGHKCAEVPVVVLVPEAIKEPFPEAVGNVQPENLVLDRTTSPASRVRQNRAALVTAWFHWLTVTVEDQFGDVLDDLYQGVEVRERWSGIALEINQSLNATGTYQDPVGVVRTRQPWHVLANSQAAQDWPQAQTLPMIAFRNKQRIRVWVGGHDVGTIRRDVIGTPPNHVEINWPP